MSDYSFAEGYTNLGYDEWLTIQNPTGSTELITVTVANGVGRVYSFAVPVGGHSRYTVDMVAGHLYHASDGFKGYEISLAVQSSSEPRSWWSVPCTGIPLAPWAVVMSLATLTADAHQHTPLHALSK